MKDEITLKNYEKTIFHELMHASGLMNSEWFVHAAEDCCGDPLRSDSKACGSVQAGIRAQRTQNIGLDFFNAGGRLARAVNISKLSFSPDSVGMGMTAHLAREFGEMILKEKMNYEACVNLANDSETHCKNEMNQNILLNFKSKILPRAKELCNEARLPPVSNRETICKRYTDAIEDAGLSGIERKSALPK